MAMIKCPHCGTFNPDNLDLCFKCKNIISDSEDSVKISKPPIDNKSLPETPTKEIDVDETDKVNIKSYYTFRAAQQIAKRVGFLFFIPYVFIYAIVRDILENTFGVDQTRHFWLLILIIYLIPGLYFSFQLYKLKSWAYKLNKTLTILFTVCFFIVGIISLFASLAGEAEVNPFEIFLALIIYGGFIRFWHKLLNAPPLIKGVLLADKIGDVNLSAQSKMIPVQETMLRKFLRFIGL